MCRIEYVQVTTSVNNMYPSGTRDYDELDHAYHDVSCATLAEVHVRSRVHAPGIPMMQTFTKAYLKAGWNAVQSTPSVEILQQKLDCLVLTLYRLLAVIGISLVHGMESGDIDETMICPRNEAGETLPAPYELELEDAIVHYGNPVCKPPTMAARHWARKIQVREYPIVLPPMENDWNEPQKWWIRERDLLDTYVRGPRLNLPEQARTVQFLDRVNQTFAWWMGGQRKHEGRRAILQYLGGGHFERDIPLADNTFPSCDRFIRFDLDRLTRRYNLF
jgi:hypothetical protein